MNKGGGRSRAGPWRDLADLEEHLNGAVQATAARSSRDALAEASLMAGRRAHEMVKSMSDGGERTTWVKRRIHVCAILLPRPISDKHGEAHRLCACLGLLGAVGSLVIRGASHSVAPLVIEAPFQIFLP